LFGGKDGSKVRWGSISNVGRLGENSFSGAVGLKNRKQVFKDFLERFNSWGVGSDQVRNIIEMGCCGFRTGSKVGGSGNDTFFYDIRGIVLFEEGGG